MCVIKLNVGMHAHVKSTGNDIFKLKLKLGRLNNVNTMNVVIYEKFFSYIHQCV